MSWNNIIQRARWDGNSNINFRRQNISTIIANSISTNYLNANFISTNYLNYDVLKGKEINTSSINACNIIGYNNYLDYIQNINIITNVITLDGQAMTAEPGGLYLNGELIGTPSTISSIADWSKFKAETDVNMANSTLKNVLGISSLYISTDTINCDTIYAIGGRIDTLYGFDQINYPYARLEVLSNDEIKTSSIYTNVLTSELIYNESEISTYSIYADLGVINTLSVENLNASNVNINNTLNVDTIKSKYIYGEDIAVSTIFTNIAGILATESGQNGILFFDANNSNGLINYAYNRSSLQYASETNIDILTRFSTIIQSFSTISLVAPNVNVIATNFLADTSNFVVNNNFYTLNSITSNSYISTLTVSDLIHTSNIDISGNINVDGLITASNIDISGNLNVDGTTNLNNILNVGGPIVFNNNLEMNGNVNFPTNTVYPLDHPFTGITQYQKDVTNVRNINSESLNIIAGATGNTVETPYVNNSYLTVGNADGVIDEWLGTPGIVTINGVNGYVPGVDTNATTALTVRGDVDIDYGELTCYNGAHFYPYAIDANAINAYGDVNIIGILSVEGDINVIGNETIEGGFEVTGLTTLAGDTNIGGLLTATGETNFLGGVTAEAGIGIIGEVGISGGDVTIAGGNTFTNNSGTVLNSGLTVNGGTVTFNNDVTINGRLIANSINISNANVSSLTIHDIHLSPNPPIAAPYPAWDSNILYVNGQGVNYETVNYLCHTSNRNNPPNTPIPLWIENAPYIEGNVVSYDDVSYICILAYNGGSTPPAFDYFHWYIDLGALWFFDSITVGSNLSRLVGDFQSYVNVGYVSTINTFSQSISSININTSTIKTSSINVDFIKPKTDVIDIIGNVNFTDGDVTLGSSSNVGFTLANYYSTYLANELIVDGPTTINNELVNRNATISTLNTRLISGVDSLNVFTDNLYPYTNGSQLGFYGTSGSASGGWYNNINSRSTNTQVITPDNTGAFSNTLFLRGNVSTQQINTSSINANNIFTIGTNSNLNYVSTHAVRTSLLLPNPGQGGVINTANLYPITTNNQIGFGGSASASWLNVWSRTFQGGQYRGESTDINSTINIRHHAVASSITVSTIISRIASTNTLNVNLANINSIAPFNVSRITTSSLIPTNNTIEIGAGGNNFYRASYFNSTITNVIIPGSAIGTIPSLDINSTIRITNTLSTQNQVVSSLTGNRIFTTDFTTTNLTASNVLSPITFCNDIQSYNGDILFGSATSNNKNFVSYYNSIFTHNITGYSNLIISGSNYFDYIHANCNTNISVYNNFDMLSNGVLMNYTNVSSIFMPVANSNFNGYTDNGIVFLGKPVDSNFYMLVKPDITGTSPPGSEGIHIVERDANDGSQIAMGRLYDNTIYTPWANVTDNLNMELCNVIFKDQATDIYFGINFSNNYLQYFQDGFSNTRYVAQDWPYFAADHYVDLSYNNIKNVNDMSCNVIDVSSNIIYSKILQPIIQCGTGNTGSAGVTITLPVAYPSSNYNVQLTYHSNPSGNKPLYHDSLTTSNFFVDGDPNADFDWCSFYIP